MDYKLLVRKVKAKGYKIKDFYPICGTTKPTWYRRAKGETVITTDWIVLLARLLDLSDTDIWMIFFEPRVHEMRRNDEVLHEGFRNYDCF